MLGYLEFVCTFRTETNRDADGWRDSTFKLDLHI